MLWNVHQYVDRETGQVCTEPLYQDRHVHFLYSHLREQLPLLFRLLTRPWLSSVLGFLNYDMALGTRMKGPAEFCQKLGVDLEECLEMPKKLNTARKVFERKIRYWECRPLPSEPEAIVSPSDSRVLVGSLSSHSSLFLKEKFFSYEELLGKDRRDWLEAFDEGDYAIFRLTPEKYHYNHSPVSGRVLDIYEIQGDHHSCNPGSVVTIATPYSKNKRVVTILDTEVTNGAGTGMVAMIEVVALMVGEIVQCYSTEKYENPRPVVPGMFLSKGMPKSLYRPGSSTNVLFFQKGRVRFADDIVRNMFRANVQTRFSQGFGRPLVETDLKVRSLLGHPRKAKTQ
ncbi:MAG TPA: phosphatidylserine decarboxylase [Terriglobia bacterium]|nr:phosphatidylserine decarboxylase [Terriglobia bacterium]